MREWMRARMRRRGKRGVNDSESTGKIGQEIPANQPTPLQPMYPEDQRRKASQAAAAETTSVKPEQDMDLVMKPVPVPVPAPMTEPMTEPGPAEPPVVSSEPP